MQKKKIKVVHVRSHTKGQSLDKLRNAEIDEAVQKRAQEDRKERANALMEQEMSEIQDEEETIGGMIDTRVAIMPNSWYQGNEVHVPEEEKEHVVRLVHEALGHVGWERMRKWFQSQDIVVQKALEVFKKVKMECELCARKGGRQRLAHNPLTIATIEKGKHFSMDVGRCNDTPGYKSSLGNDRFLVIVDNGGGRTKVYPLKGETTKRMIQCLCDFMTEEQNPETVRTDNASVFVSKAFEDALQSLGLTHVYSIPYKSNTNGVAERAVGLAKQQISLYDKAWDQPVNLLKINQILSREKLQPLKQNTKNIPLDLQVGDQVWVTGRGKITQGVITTELEGSAEEQGDYKNFERRRDSAPRADT